MRAYLRTYGPVGPLEPDSVQPLDLPEGSTVAQVLALCGVRSDLVMFIFVNERPATLDSVLGENDTLGLCSLVCGG